MEAKRKREVGEILSNVSPNVPPQTTAKRQRKGADGVIDLTSPEPETRTAPESVTEPHRHQPDSSPPDESRIQFTHPSAVPGNEIPESHGQTRDFRAPGMVGNLPTPGTTAFYDVTEHEPSSLTANGPCSINVDEDLPQIDHPIHNGRRPLTSGSSILQPEGLDSSYNSSEVKQYTQSNQPYGGKLSQFGRKPSQFGRKPKFFRASDHSSTPPVVRQTIHPVLGKHRTTSASSQGSSGPPPSHSPPIIDLSQDDAHDHRMVDPRVAYGSKPKDGPKPNKKERKPKSEPELCAEQQNLVNLILSGRNVFYTGSAGCGKSTVLKAFVSELKERGRTVSIIAPTGKAALEVNGSTYFTFAGWTPDHFKKPLDKLKHDAHAKFVRKRMRDVQVLVIDEISMMENHAFERLNEVMKEARASGEAFGGVQLVVTGDFCQLPPVKPFKYCMHCGREMGSLKAGTAFKCAMHGEFLEVDKWAFRSQAWASCQFEHVNLTTIHRQSDRTFIDILERCRMGKQLSETETKLLLNHECDVENAVKLYSTREEVRRINYGEYMKLTTQPRSFKCFDDFHWQPNHPQLKWKDQRLPDGSLKALAEQKFESYMELKEGMAVVLQVNLNIEQGLVNGSQGVVTGWEPYDENKMPKAVDREQGGSKKPDPINPILGGHAAYRETKIKEFVMAIGLKEWPIVKFDNGVTRTIYAECYVSELGDEPPYSLLSRTQIPLLPGWAMTVHKSQGMTLNKVVVDLSKSFEEGQMYVALSRARSLNGLKVEGLGKTGSGNLEVMQFLNEKFGIDTGV